MKQMIPYNLRSRIKLALMDRYRLAPERTAAIPTLVLQRGVTNFLSFEYEEMKKKTLAYLQTRRSGAYEYTYSESAGVPTLYSSIYACMLMGLYGELDGIGSAGRAGWADYLNGFQSDDGFFRDPAISGEEFENDGNWGDGWGIRHLAGHAIIAYARLAATPKYPFRFLEPFYSEAYLDGWLDAFDFSNKVWTSSNYIMNICTLLQYSRDYMGDARADKSVKQILSWLRMRQSKDTGMWHSHPLDDYKRLSDAIRGAYHFYPLFLYEDETVAGRERAIDWILKSQNSWGAFEDEKKPSGACEDVDAIDPLIRFVVQTGYRKGEADLAIKRALIWVLSNLNDDGGFVFMLETPHDYGSHPATSSKLGESNLFATWFRTLCLAYMAKYLGVPNDFDIGHFPGYEITL